jgi:hypothetical protein
MRNEHSGADPEARTVREVARSTDFNTHTDDMREALTAYMERRPPTFKGR